MTLIFRDNPFLSPVFSDFRPHVESAGQCCGGLQAVLTHLPFLRVFNEVSAEIKSTHFRTVVAVWYHDKQVCNHFSNDYFVGFLKGSVCDGLGESKILFFILSTWRICYTHRVEMKPREDTRNPVPWQPESLGNYQVQGFSNFRAWNPVK